MNKTIKTCHINSGYRAGKNIVTLYYELLMAVSTKYPDETRHQTALRYIKECENRATNKEGARCTGTTE